ncbi:hypothetical protein BH23CHL2_BH23CHL2_23440 [soil metagenome]
MLPVRCVTKAGALVGVESADPCEIEIPHCVRNDVVVAGALARFIWRWRGASRMTTRDANRDTLEFPGNEVGPRVEGQFINLSIRSRELPGCQRYAMGPDVQQMRHNRGALA